jgi:hypothetical protein
MFMKLLTKKTGYILLLIIFLTAVSCSRTVPEITFGFIKLVLYEGETGPQEYFSFFIIPEDEDGMENLDELYLFHDREQLRWHIKSDEWLTYTHNERTWIGTRSIAVQEGSLPRGVYRAVLVNKGGERGERSFTYDGGARFPFPVFEVEEGMYTIRSEWPVNRLVCYDRNGNYHSTVEVHSLTGDISQLNIHSSVRTASLWAEDPEYFSSAFTNVVSVR